MQGVLFHYTTQDNKNVMCVWSENGAYIELVSNEVSIRVNLYGKYRDVLDTLKKACRFVGVDFMEVMKSCYKVLFGWNKYIPVAIYECNESNLRESSYNGEGAIIDFIMDEVDTLKRIYLEEALSIEKPYPRSVLLQCTVIIMLRLLIETKNKDCKQYVTSKKLSI